jgi:hypothetical protein
MQGLILATRCCLVYTFEDNQNGRAWFGRSYFRNHHRLGSPCSGRHRALLASGQFGLGRSQPLLEQGLGPQQVKELAHYKIQNLEKMRFYLLCEFSQEPDEWLLELVV